MSKDLTSVSFNSASGAPTSWQLESFSESDSISARRKPMNVFELEEYLKEQERLLNPALPESQITEEEVPPPPPTLTEEEIEQIKLQAREEAYQQGLAQGYQDGLSQGTTEGHERGYKDGYQSGKQQIDQELQQLQVLLVDLATVFNEFETTVAPQLMALILNIAKQVIRQDTQQNPTIIQTVLKEACQHLLGTESHKQLLLNPADYQLIFSTHGAELQQTGWQLIADETITQGGCHIKTQQSSIDASIETRWKNVIQTLGQDIAWSAS